MSNMVSFSQANLPAISSLSTALRSLEKEVGPSGTVILKMDKTGHWVYGADQTEVEDNSTWAIPAHEPQWAIFAPIKTGIAAGTKAANIVICIDGMGLWTYRPVECPIEWSRQNDSLDRAYLGPFMGEQGAFSPLNLAEGLLSAADGAAYLTTNDIGTITAQCTWNEDRIIYAAGNTLWFSDPYMPQAVLAATATPWFAVQVGNDPELPRVPWRSVVYALRAAVAESR